MLVGVFAEPRHAFISFLLHSSFFHVLQYAEQSKQRKKVNKMRRDILGKRRAKAQIQEFIDNSVREQQEQAVQAQKLRAETDNLTREHDAEEKAERHKQLAWEQEYK